MWDPLTSRQYDRKLADAWETLDLVDLVEHRHRKDSANSGDRLQAKEVLRIVKLGTAFEEQLELANRVVVLPQQFKVQLNRRFATGMLEAIRNADPVRFVGDLFWRRVRGCAGDLQSECASTFAPEAVLDESVA